VTPDGASVCSIRKGEKRVTNTCAQNYKFEGKERDTETGNDDFGARYYSNHFGRWLSPDWSAVPAPVPYANLTNPQTLNLYGMVSDNPESFSDLDGHTSPCGLDSCPAATKDPACNSANVDAPAGACAQESGAEYLRENMTAAGNGNTDPAKDQQKADEKAQYQLSAKGLAFIKKWEGGFHSHVYDASGKKHLGDWTIGYGHKVYDPTKYSKGISKAQATALLQGDVAAAVAGVNRYATAILNQNQVDALVSFTFNEGVGRFEHSSLRADVVEGNKVPEGDFTEYDRSGGYSNRGLLNRREAEYELYRSW